MDFIHRRSYFETLLTSAARTASGNTQTTPIDVSIVQEAELYINVTVVSGTSPILYVVAQSKSPSANAWMEITRTGNITAASQNRLAMPANLGRSFSIVWIISGTDPSFTFTVGMIMKT